MRSRSMLLATVLFAMQVAAAQAGDTRRVSVGLGGAQGNGESRMSVGSLSASGRSAVFVSRADNLVPGDTNGVADVFVRGLRPGGGTQRVNLGPGGAEASPSFLESDGATISADGRFVAFYSGASNLVRGVTNGLYDIFVRERAAGVTTRVSVGPGGAQADGSSVFPTISADGRFVCFTSSASNLVAGDTNNDQDAFVHDRQTGRTTRVSVGTGGVQANSFSSNPAISANGRFVVFISDATNLVPNDTNRVSDIFIHDRQAGKTSRVSVGAGGRQANGFSSVPQVSPNGHFVSFYSKATNLVPGDTNRVGDVFVHDRQTRKTSRVSVATGGAEANRDSADSSISADGRFVAFFSEATNLVAGDSNLAADIFVHDRQTRRTSRVSVGADGTQANGRSFGPTISPDGKLVAFGSVASNLVPGDTNGVSDAFVRTR